MHPARHPMPPDATVAYLRIATVAGVTRGFFGRVSAASTPWGMARYRMRQPPARFAPVAERDHCPTGRAPAELPGRTGELVENHGIEPRVARGVRFTAGWVCRIPHSPKRCARYSAGRLANSTSGRPILVQPRVLVLPKMPSQPILWPSAFTAAAPSI